MSNLKRMFQEFEKMCAPVRVYERDFNRLILEEAEQAAAERGSSAVHAKDEQVAFDRLLEAFEEPLDPPVDWGHAAALVARFRSLGLYGMMMAWQCQEQSELHPNTQWTRSYINKLPDSAFLYIEPGGQKDAQGKTTPRRLRHFPYKSHTGSVDIPHVKDALSRIPQSDVSQRAKDEARRKAERIYEQHGGYR